METSQARKDASRRNGALSRGPITPEGKQRSAGNAVTHGLLAKTICLLDEDPTMFDHILQEMKEAIRPRNGAELGCVEEIAVAAYQLRRAWGIEGQMVQNEIDRLPKADGFILALADSFANLAANSPGFALVQRYAARHANEKRRALRDLIELRKAIAAMAELPNEPRSPMESTEPQKTL